MRTAVVCAFFSICILAVGSANPARVNSTDALPGRVTQGPPPPSPPRLVRFSPYMVAIEGKIIVREGDRVIVGEVAADCGPEYQQFWNVALTGETPPFVSLIDDSLSCATTSKFRSLILLAPQRGDAGKYKITISGDACGSSPTFLTVDVRVKPGL